MDKQHKILAREFETPSEAQKADLTDFIQMLQALSEEDQKALLSAARALRKVNRETKKARSLPQQRALSAALEANKEG